MSITATVTQHVVFSGDQLSELIWNSGELGQSPAQQLVVTLDAGDNSIPVPDIDGFVMHGLAIIPPYANEIEPMLKGDASDTGIALSATKVSVLQLGGSAPPSEIILNVSEELVGLRLVWF